MFAHRVKRNVLEDDHFAVPQFVADLEFLNRVHIHTHEKFGIHLGKTPRRFKQTLALFIFANGNDNFFNSSFYFILVEQFTILYIII
jgi:hypothetical protein